MKQVHNDNKREIQDYYVDILSIINLVIRQFISYRHFFFFFLIVFT